VDDSVYDYILQIVQRTRTAENLHLGASPRGTLALARTAQSLATARGRDFVTPDDIKRLAVSTLAHRLMLAPHARLGDIHPVGVLDDILDEVAVPV
jgi:MoxR-like ATPase